MRATLPGMTSGSSDHKRRVRATLGIGEVARRSGLAVSAIHYYEAQGLIRSWRDAGNRRRFPRDVLRRLAVIRVAQRAGLTLVSVREAFSSLPNERTPNASDWQRLSAAWTDELDNRIGALTELRDQLSSCIGCGCLSLSECPLRNPGDQLADEGSGARLLESQD